MITNFERNHYRNNAINDVEALNNVLDEDVDIFDMGLAYQDNGSGFLIANVPVRLRKGELLQAQSNDDFCQTILTRQSGNIDSKFFVGPCNDGLLRLQHPTDPEGVEIVLPETL